MNKVIIIPDSIVTESLGLNSDKVSSKDALTMPHRTGVDPESRRIKVLNEALKNAILKEFRTA